jgi:PPOX class probable F420-dependent enzyme
MDAQTMRHLAESVPVGHLGTVGADGQPHVVPVCFVLIAETAYTAVDHKPKRTTRLRRLTNVAATGHACLLVDRYSEDWSTLWWVRLDGQGRVADDPDEVRQALVSLRAKYQQYAERPPTGPVIAVDVTRWSAWSAAE